MNQDFLFNQKKVIAKNTLEMKTQVHGFLADIEEPEDFLNVYGEESGHIKYKEPQKGIKVLIVNSTQENMKASSKLLNSTENTNLYLLCFEDDIFPRNTRIKLYMQSNSYRQLQIRDNLKNEGTFTIRQELVPCVNTVDTEEPEKGLNIKVDTNTKKGIGNNL